MEGGLMISNSQGDTSFLSFYLFPLSGKIKKAGFPFSSPIEVIALIHLNFACGQGVELLPERRSTPGKFRSSLHLFAK